MINEITSRSEFLSKQDADLLDRLDFIRLDAGRRQEKDRQTRLGQFFTPAPVARLMASMFTCHSSTVHILDAGAGVGSLFAACVADLCSRDKRPQKICPPLRHSRSDMPRREQCTVFPSPLLQARRLHYRREDRISLWKRLSINLRRFIHPEGKSSMLAILTTNWSV